MLILNLQTSATPHACNTKLIMHHLCVHTPTRSKQLGDCAIFTRATVRDMAMDTGTSSRRSLSLSPTPSLSSSPSPSSSVSIKSDVWKFFEKTVDSSKAKCSLCSKQLSYRGGTSNLRDHLISQHPFNYKPKLVVRSK